MHKACQIQTKPKPDEMSKHRQKHKIWIIFGVFLFLIYLLPQNSLAAGLNMLSDKVSRHAPLVGANHEIKFTTPSGVGGSGQLIRISFDSGFNLSGVIYSDIILSHGSVTGMEITENVSEVASADNWGFNVSDSSLELLHPTDSSNGDIAPNDKVVIKILSSHIINPATLGSKIIAISTRDNFGNVIDSGKLAVPIYDDQIGVGGSTSDALPNPVTLNFPYNVTASSLDIDWTQNIDFNFNRYELYMSTTAGVTNLSGDLLLSSADQTQTIYNIAGLAPSRTYYFVVYVYNTLGTGAISNEVFTTTQSSGGPIWPDPPAQPTINERICPIFLSQTNINGTKPLGTTIFINGSPDDITYPDVLSWDKLVSLAMGSNLYLIYARDSYGQTSSMLTATVNRCEVGDTNCNSVVDDFDLAGLAGHWNADWCYADFNVDGIVDDFDLSGLAAHWDSVY